MVNHLQCSMSIVNGVTCVSINQFYKTRNTQSGLVANFSLKDMKCYGIKSRTEFHCLTPKRSKVRKLPKSYSRLEYKL